MKVQRSAFVVLAGLLIFVQQSVALEFDGPCMSPLGMQNYAIQDSQLSASSETTAEREKYGKQSARLNYKYSWRAEGKEGAYLQVNFGRLATVRGIATQGDVDKPWWVTSFTIKHSLDGNAWKALKSYTGNSKEIKLRKHLFDKALTTRHIRVVPLAWHGGIAMRIELYGCYATCDNHPVGIASGYIKDSQIKATSTLNKDTRPRYARLDYEGKDAWCAGADDKNPVLQIDLGVAHVLCAVATQGNVKSDEMVTKYLLATSMDGKKWQDYKENNQIKMFVGNTDNNITAKNYLNEATVGRYVRLVPKGYRGARCMRIELYGVKRTTCDISASGLGEPFPTIPDYRFVATSHLHHKYVPYHARTQNSHCWQPKATDKLGQLQIDLGAPHILCGVGIQPTGQSFRIDERTLTFKVAFSMDGTKWTYYHKEIPGNKYPDSHYPTVHIDKYAFSRIHIAKFVVIEPIKYKGMKSVRAELYGLKQAWKSSLGLEKVKGQPYLSDSQITASSYLHEDFRPKKARLYGIYSWCAGVKDPSPYLQIDLGTVKELNGMAIQRNSKYPVWVSSYSLGYGIIKSRMSTVLKEVPFKIDVGTNVIWLKKPVFARFIRVTTVKKYRDNACMRVDFYGNSKAPPPENVKIQTMATEEVKIGLGNHMSFRCTAKGDDKVKIKWSIKGKSVANSTYTQTYSNTKITSDFKLPLERFKEIKERFQCEIIAGNRLQCDIVVSCVAYRVNAFATRDDVSVRITMDVPKEYLPKPTTIPPMEYPTLNTKKKTKGTSDNRHHKTEEKPTLKLKKKVEINPFKADFWRIFSGTSKSSSRAWVLVATGIVGVLLL